MAAEFCLSWGKKMLGYRGTDVTNSNVTFLRIHKKQKISLQARNIVSARRNLRQKYTRYFHWSHITMITHSTAQTQQLYKWLYLSSHCPLIWDVSYSMNTASLKRIAASTVKKKWDIYVCWWHHQILNSQQTLDMSEINYKHLSTAESKLDTVAHDSL